MQLLLIKSGARGGVHHLQRLLGAIGPLARPGGGQTVVRANFARGIDSVGLVAHVATARRALADLVTSLDAVRQAYGVQTPPTAKGFGVLARAMRSERPGIVFARAAANEEVDPLTDLDSRLFVGLRP